MKNKSLLTSQNGSALIICLLSLAVLSALGTAALMVSATNQTIAGNYRKQSQAFFVAEAGLQKAIAELKNDMIWRGEGATETVKINGVDVAVPASEGDMVIGNITAEYTVKIFDTSTDITLPGGYIRLVSEGVFQDSRQTVESIVLFSPDPDFKANSPSAAVVTSGENHAKGTHVINGYDNDGVIDTDDMVRTDQYLPDVNQAALKMFADITIDGDLTDGQGLTSFWKDPSTTPPTPYVIYVDGNLNLSGNTHVYGIIFVTGEVRITGSARVIGVVYAPNTSDITEIKGAGKASEQPIIGQLICGTGGIQPAGNHGDIQLVQPYVDAFNNFGGAVVNVNPAPGSWRQY